MDALGGAGAGRAGGGARPGGGARRAGGKAAPPEPPRGAGRRRARSRSPKARSPWPGAGAMRRAAALVLLAAALSGGGAAAAARSCPVQSLGCKCGAERPKAPSGPAAPRRRVVCSGGGLPVPPEPRLLPDGTATL